MVIEWLNILGFLNKYIRKYRNLFSFSQIVGMLKSGKSARYVGQAT